VFFQISETFLQISVTHQSGSAERKSVVVMCWTETP
jgi:hypothetical protein